MRYQLLFLGFFLALFQACGTESKPAMDSAIVEDQPGLTSLDLATLARVKRALQVGDSAFLPAFQKLLSEADTALQAPLHTVMDKSILPASGDKHDYLSLGPYWWPDPAAPDGLPWIRRDGEVNPLTRGKRTDVKAKNGAFNNIELLALAAYFSGEEKYAQRSLEQLRAWFLDPATRMNPHLQFGQGIPGINTGRGIGIIETIALGKAITGMEILQLEGWLPPADQKALDAWLTDFTHWLMTSEMGIAEREWHNNHGTWYDVQVVVLLRHLGREAEARGILETAKEKRIAAHLEADGAQPHELERTKSLNYSTMNLKGLTSLAYHGQQLGVELWNYLPADGGDLRAAYAYLQPYAFTDKEWPYEQLGSLQKAKARARRLFYETGARMNIPAFCALQNGEDVAQTSPYRLLYACPNP